MPLNTEKSYLNSRSRVQREDLLKFLKNGGMPGIFGIKSEQNRFEALADWISFKKIKNLGIAGTAGVALGKPCLGGANTKKLF